MNKLVTYINRGLAAFTVSLSTFLVFCVVWQVLSRYVLGKPSTVTDELARYLFMWVALIGAAYTTGLKRHLAIDLLTMKLKGKKKLVNEIVIQVAIALFSYVVLVHGGTQLALKTSVAFVNVNTKNTDANKLSAFVAAHFCREDFNAADQFLAVKRDKLRDGFVLNTLQDATKCCVIGGWRNQKLPLGVHPIPQRGEALEIAHLDGSDLHSSSLISAGNG